jgi:AraC family transcriptional regulator, exoenzyme S synthesis regulatory protein ExsA
MVSLFDFVNDNCLFRQFKVNDLLFVEYKCVVDETTLKIWSQHNYFIYVLQGKKIWKTIKQDYEVFSGEAIFVRKGANIVHQFLDKQFCSLIIFVPDQFIVDVIKNSDIRLIASKAKSFADSVMRVEVDKILRTYFDSVLAYFGHKDGPPPSLLELKFKELILNIISSRCNSHLSEYLRSLCEKNTACMREIMERNYAYNMKLEQYALLCGQSLTSFKRNFKSTFHTTPGKWLIRKKLEYARHLLSASDKNINEISFDCGFENTSHFIRIFRQTYDSTPLQYKKNVTQLTHSSEI